MPTKRKYVPTKQKSEKPEKPEKPRWSRSGEPLNDPAIKAEIDRCGEMCLPTDVLTVLISQHGYTDVEVTQEEKKYNYYDVFMQSPLPVERAVVRQQLERVVAQIPESPTHHFRWRVEMCAVISANHHIAAQIKVTWFQRAA